MNFLNTVGTMTAPGNTFHKLNIHQIHSAFRFTFSTSKFLALLCCWIMERDPQSFYERDRQLLDSFCRLDRPQSCLKVTRGKNGTQTLTLTSSNNKILSFCFIGYFFQTQILYLREIIPHKISCWNCICSCTLHLIHRLSSCLLPTWIVWFVLYICNCFAINLHWNNFPSLLLCSFYWLHLPISPPDQLLFACKNACPIVDVTL